MRAASTADGSSLSPQGMSMFIGRTPYASHISAQRSPNFPLLTTIALSPGESMFVTAPSMAPVPEEANIRTSLRVPKRNFRPVRTSSTTVSNIGFL